MLIFHHPSCKNGSLSCLRTHRVVLAVMLPYRSTIPMHWRSCWNLMMLDFCQCETKWAKHPLRELSSRRNMWYLTLYPNWFVSNVKFWQPFEFSFACKEWLEASSSYASCSQPFKNRSNVTPYRLPTTTVAFESFVEEDYFGRTFLSSPSEVK